MRSFWFGGLFLALAACNREDAPADGPAAFPVTPPAILAAFRKDLEVCAAIVRTMKPDRRFIEAFKSVQVRQARSREELLRESPLADSAEYRYVLANPQFIFLGVSFHGDPFAVAWVEDEGIFCGPTFRRLKNIEALGESQEAWTVREFFLTKFLESLTHPSDEQAAGTIGFGTLEPLVREASEFYKGAQRPRFQAWVRKAVETVEASRARIRDGAAGLTAAEQGRILDEQIAALKGFTVP